MATSCLLGHYPLLGSGALAATLRAQGSTWPWRLRTVSTCASTETLLQQWLRCGTTHGPCAMVARRQRHGRGQWGRSWWAPPGGVWLSAAWPLPAEPQPKMGTEALGLAAAAALMEWLERLGLTTVAFKWPNDILLGDRKLAGLLPHRHWRAGAPHRLGLGLGLNVTNNNTLPPGAVTLSHHLGHRTPPLIQAQAAALLACERAMDLLLTPDPNGITTTVAGCQVLHQAFTARMGVQAGAQTPDPTVLSLPDDLP